MGKRKKKSHKKGRTFWVLFSLILIGIVFSMLYLFRHEISNLLKPWGEKWSVIEKKKGVTLYFSDSEGGSLIGEKREILKKGEIKEEAKETIIELIKGPKGKLIPTLPPRTELLSLQLDREGVVQVNFSRALSKDHPGGSSAEMMTIYSIVNSLTLNFPEIKFVQILIEGKRIETIAGHLSTKQPFSSNSGLIKKLE